MASKRRNMFYKNKKQETAEIASLFDRAEDSVDSCRNKLLAVELRAVTDPRDGRRVALKKLPNVFQSLVSSKRVFRELKMLCFFKHENETTDSDIYPGLSSHALSPLVTTGSDYDPDSFAEDGDQPKPVRTDELRARNDRLREITVWDLPPPATGVPILGLGGRT
ncbi:hypothetical protein AAG570_010478 [Ranatra chinensis]|uniref:Uncharacterized protein n=1 Tax=Ranatra chinensis TaxID=642074 RepID=A0ABD0Z4Q8_9HEMI